MAEVNFPIGSRVALKDGMDAVYLLALPQAEGFVRDHKVDPDGFPLVYVEWDTDHWRFNGQRDGWTFEEHFDLKERPSVSEHEPKPELSDFLAQLQGEPPKISDEQAQEFFDELSDALEHATDGEGFLLISVRRRQTEEGEVVVYPEIFASTLTEEAGLLLDAQLAQIAALSYQDMIFKLVDLVQKQRRQQ